MSISGTTGELNMFAGGPDILAGNSGGCGPPDETWDPPSRPAGLDDYDRFKQIAGTLLVAVRPPAGRKGKPQETTLGVAGV